MDIAEHKKKFDLVVKKYNLTSDTKAEEIATFLTSKKNGEKISSEEFATLFAMDEADAKVFLSFIEKGLEFRNSSLKN